MVMFLIKESITVPHDGQKLPLSFDLVLPDLLHTTRSALSPCETLLKVAITQLRGQVTTNGRVSKDLIEANQIATHGLAWLATYVESLRQMQRWAETLESHGKFGEVEQLLHQIAFGEYLWQIHGGIPISQSELIRLQDIGLTKADHMAFMSVEVETLTQHGNTQAARSRLVVLMQEQLANITTGACGLDDELEMIREQFYRYAMEKAVSYTHLTLPTRNCV